MTTRTVATAVIMSRNGEIRYADGFGPAPCDICHEERTDVRDLTSGIVICIYCANQRKDGYQPSSYLGSA
jgi:hypothetical protein